MHTSNSSTSHIASAASSSLTAPTSISNSNSNSSSGDSNGSSSTVPDDLSLAPPGYEPVVALLPPLPPMTKHRELPVDVPDSFIEIVKTPPRYPPPAHLSSRGSLLSNGSASTAQTTLSSLPPAPVAAVGPATAAVAATASATATAGGGGSVSGIGGDAKRVSDEVYHIVFVL
ncbi:GL13193 [Drosophila persimilis]|uniref:GL13193 n=1 Tax=Drosophila persimilis TaxID=7234 RepID=B4IRS8_DROPE|nr:GL13193 [Drosophila persimilis]